MNWKNRLANERQAVINELLVMKAEALGEEPEALAFHDMCDYDEFGIMLMFNVTEETSPKYKGTFSVIIRDNVINLGTTNETWGR